MVGLLRRCVRGTVSSLIATVALCAAGPASAQSASSVYTIGNYPIEATAGNAVAAKERALTDGRQAALRSLLKRIVPVTAYSRLKGVKAAKANELIDGVVVRSERTSETQYIANLDFSFYPQAVRDLLRREGIPFVDTQAPEIVLVPVYISPSAGQGPVPADLSPPRGSRMWKEAWDGLDLEHTLTPAKLSAAKPEVSAELVSALKEGDGRALGTLARAYAADRILLAMAEPDLAAKRLHVTLAGRDAVGDFVLKRSWRMELDDVSYAAELAAVVALGTIEGRWKAASQKGGTGGDAFGSTLMPVHLVVEFRSMQQWQEVHRQLAQLPGMDNIEIGGLSARSADVAAVYPGGPEALAGVLSGRGMDVRQIGGVLQVRAGL